MQECAVILFFFFVRIEVFLIDYRNGSCCLNSSNSFEQSANSNVYTSPFTQVQIGKKITVQKNYV